MGTQPHRVVLHIGTPKSGTTFLQRLLWDNRAALERRGFRCPGDRQVDMFLAAVELRESHEFWGYDPADLAGRWSEVCRQARGYSGTTVMSHEVLAGASEEQVARAYAELEGLDVHVVLTARDLARQATSEWQERVKNGSTRSFARFERRLNKQIDRGTFDKGFWRSQDPVGILDRWTRDLPPDHVHVVVAPQSSADPTLLWRRFAAALGMDAADLEEIDVAAAPRAANASLGAAQVQVLRQVNIALDGRVPHPAYARVVKSDFAERVLAAQTSERPQCPPELVDRLRVLAADRNETIRRRGYAVHGDLDELVPRPVDGPYRSPDDVPRRAEQDAFARALADLLVQRADRRARSLPTVISRAVEAEPGAAQSRLRRLRGRFTRARS